MEILTLSRGESVVEALQQWLLGQERKRYYIVGGIGSLASATLASPKDDHFPPAMQFLTLQQGMEVTSLTGELTPYEWLDPVLKDIYGANAEQDWFVHLHASMSTPTCTVVGGGLREATVLRSLTLWIQAE
jgi:predicted DNA-binding protein with PD1-like motif